MRSKIFTLLVAALSATTASAQWNTGSKPVSLYDCTGKGDYYINSPLAARTADGKTWLSYMLRENGGTHTYVQLLDSNGVKQFDGLGIQLNDYVSPTWWSGYCLTVASDGAALVSVSDSRGEEGATSGSTFVPAIYKISQDGNFDWGLNGISFPYYQNSPYTQIYVNGDDVFFQFTENSDEKGGTYVNRISMDGVVAFDSCKAVAGQLVPSLDGDFLQVSTATSGVQIDRLNRNMESVWGESVLFDSYDNNSYDLQPFSVAPDGDGGVAVAFVRNMGMFAHNVRVQHISADGELGFGLTAIDAYDSEDGDHSYCGVGVNPTTKQIMVDWEDQLADENEESYYTTSVGTFSYSGERGLGNYGKQVLTKKSDTGYAYGRIGLEPLSNGDWILAVRDFQDFSSAKITVMRLNKDGEQLWQQSYGDDISVTDPTMMVDSAYTYIVYRNSNSLDVLRLSNADGSSQAAGVPTAPQQLTAQTVDANSIKVTLKADDDTQVLVAVTDSTVTNATTGRRYTNTGVFGNPAGTYAVGDEIDGGGRIVYIGKAGDFTADNLAAGTLHFFKAWATDGNGTYNTDAVTAVAYTAAYTPWDANISLMPSSCVPAGWGVSSDEAFTKDNNYGIVGTVGTTPVWIETPDIYLPEKPTRVVAEMTMETTSGYESVPYTFADGDTLKVQVTTDGVNYKDIAVYTADNDPTFKTSDYINKFNYTFTDYAGQKARLRFYVHSSKAAEFYLGSLKVAEKSDCDYPDSLKLVDTDKDMATVAWSSQGEEGTWEVSYKLSDSDEWGDVITTTERQYTFEGLAASTSYDVRVRAVCSATSRSEWSEVMTFSTGLFVPFDLVISNLSSMGEWLSGSGALADPTEFSSCYDFSFYYYGIGSLSFYSYDETCNSWLISPQIDLGTGGEYTLTFEYTTGYESGWVTTSTDSKMQLLVSTDGENFYTKDTLFTIGHDYLKDEATDYTFSVPVKGYNGTVRLGLYVTSTTGAPLPFDITRIALTNGATGINSTKKDTANDNKVTAIYNAAGQRTNAMTRGINIVRHADGTTQKILMK